MFQKADLQRQKEKEEAILQRQKEKEEAEMQRQKDKEEAELQRKKEKEEAEMQRQKDKEEAELQRKKEKEEAEMQRQKDKEEAELQRKKEKEEAEMQRKILRIEIAEDIAKAIERVEKRLDEVQHQCNIEHKKLEEEIDGKINKVEEKLVKEVKENIKECLIKIQEWIDGYKNMEKKMQQKEIVLNCEMEDMKGKIKNNQEKIQEIEENIQGRDRNGINEEQHNQILTLREELNKEIKMLKTKQAEQQQLEIRYVTCDKSAPTVKFNGKISVIHPMVFIKSIKNKCKIIHDSEELKQVIRENLEGEANVWFTGKESDIENIKEFEQQFLNQYWGNFNQNMIRERLYFGKYNDKMSNTMTNYALRLYANAKYLTPQLNENEI
ncbi:vicilin-like seed storage protein At2g18540, partial [Anoplophora glabripennis]|uniref:vicilin-like seed storage protein At2g18540 n=1 Tax=Anoplophora glabripennis TaxID=217634 RepID=UPI000C77F49A